MRGGALTAARAASAPPLRRAKAGVETSARRGIFRTVLGVAVVVAAAAMPGFALTDAANAAPEVTRRAKVDLLLGFQKRYGGPPELLILGSSRAMRADPAQVRAALHLRTFNAAVSSGTVPDAFAFLQLARDRYPEARPAVLWFLDVESMRLTGVHQYLLSVKRLAGQLPPEERDRVALSRSLAAGAAAGGPVVRPRWHKDGLLVSWWHDRQRAQGRSAAAGVRYHQRQFASIYGGGRRPRLSGSAKWYATQIVRQANEMGVAPVVVLTPYHPQLRSFLLSRGWRAAHRQVRAFLRDLGRRFSLRVVDLTAGEVVDGRAVSWYDGVHPRAGQMRRIVRAVLRQAGDDLRAGAPAVPASGERPPAADAGAAGTRAGEHAETGMPAESGGPDDASGSGGAGSETAGGLQGSGGPEDDTGTDPAAEEEFPWPELLPPLPPARPPQDGAAFVTARVSVPSALPSTWPLLPAPYLL